jgi:hypothetical protein
MTPFDHAIRVRQSAFDVSLVDRNLLEGKRRLLRIVVRRTRPIVDVNGGLGERVPVGVRQEDHGLRSMTGHAFGQTRLVLVDQCDEIPAGNIAIIHDRESTAIEFTANAGDLTGRNRRPNRASIQKVGE